MDDYVAKPIRVEELVAALERCAPSASAVAAEATAATLAEEELPVLDRQVFDELREAAGDDFMPEMIGEFLEDSPRQIAGMRESAARGDQEELRRCAHSLKTTSATLGLPALAARCRELEELARIGVPAGADDLISTVEAAYQPAATALAAAMPAV
jgi:two-component system sensor histidine kinase/response regulator